MAEKQEAVALAGAHGSKGIEADGACCPPECRGRQRERLLADLLGHRGISTVQARDRLRMMQPASRVEDLRRDCGTIIRHHDRDQGCGRYHLLVGRVGDHA